MNPLNRDMFYKGFQKHLKVNLPSKQATEAISVCNRPYDL